MPELQFTINRYGGIFIDSASVAKQPTEFSQQLQKAITVWRTNGYITAWISLSLQDASLIPTAVNHGFLFHSTHRNVLTLVCKLNPNAEFPDEASHYLGGGGVVINENGELLVVRERVHNSATPGRYKLPGGFIHAGEHVADGIVREVFEETGIKATFDGLVCFRHWHVERFGKSDIYCVCKLTPLTEEISMQESEIMECHWMSVDTFLQHDDVGDFNKGAVQTAVNGNHFIHGWFGSYPAKELLHKYELFVPNGAGDVAH
jgi:8-oxo-dGTP diphosphatase